MFRRIFIAAALAVLSAAAELPAADKWLAGGRVLAVSEIPSPEKSDYPDCDYTVDFEVCGVYSGPGTLPERVVLLLPAFRKNQMCKENLFKANDLIEVSVMRHEDLPPEQRKIQQADDFHFFDREFLFGEAAVRVKQLRKASIAPSFVNVKPKISTEPLNPPQSPAAAEARKKQIETDLEHITKLYKLENSQYQVYSKIYAQTVIASQWPMNGRYWVMHKKGAFATLDSKHLPFRPREYRNWRKEVQPVVAIRDYLAMHNIDLICVPIPYAADIAAGVMFPSVAKHYNINHLLFLAALRQRGIETIDLVPDLTDRFLDYKLMFYYHVFNWHPHEGCVDVATDLVAERLKRYGFKRDASMKFSKIYKQNTGWLSNKYTWFGPEDSNAEPHILLNGEEFDPDDSGAQVMVLGNSFAETPGGGGSNAFAKFLAMKLGMPVSSLIGSSNSFLQSLPRQILWNEDKYLKDLKVVVMVAGLNYWKCSNATLTEMRQRLLASGAMEKIIKLDNSTVILSAEDKKTDREKRCREELAARNIFPRWGLVNPKGILRITIPVPEEVYNETMRKKTTLSVSFDYHSGTSAHAEFMCENTRESETRSKTSGNEVFFIPHNKLSRNIVIQLKNSTTHSFLLGIDNVRIHY